MNIAKIIKRIGLFMAMPLFALSMTVASCDTGNTNTADADRTDNTEIAEPVETDTVSYIPDEIDTMLVIEDTIQVTPDTAGRKEDLEKMEQ